jgi:hypothetical protein
MKTFADVKRRVRVGTVLVQTYSVLVRPEGPQTELLPPRKVVKVQTNAWKLEGCAYSKGQESWLYFPRAARQVRIDGPDAFTFLDAPVPGKVRGQPGPELVPYLSYRIVDSPAETVGG